jgi:tRNA (guanine10-N2)-dimethyltransferase
MTPESGSQDHSFLFELSGEHESLPYAEIEGCLEAQVLKFAIKTKARGVLILDAPKMDIKKMQRRLALSHYIDSHLFFCEVNEISDIKESIEIYGGSFAVRAKRIQSAHPHVDLKQVERQVADLVKGEYPVDLENPENEIRVILSNKLYVGKKLAKIPRSTFEDRKVQNRPYFSPVSLHPRLARALVNLSRIKEGQTLLDPFCGTGGVLMEAALVGAKTIGSDIDERMVRGAEENLSNLNIESGFFGADISKVKDSVKEVDAIATDPPYGKAATTNREDVFSLYKRAFEAFSGVLKPRGYASVVLPDLELIEMGKEYLNLKETHSMKVHRSLTRHFCVFKKE